MLCPLAFGEDECGLSQEQQAEETKMQINTADLGSTAALVPYLLGIAKWYHL
jgi:hypothetical protein